MNGLCLPTNPRNAQARQHYGAFTHGSQLGMKKAHTQMRSRRFVREIAVSFFLSSYCLGTQFLGIAGIVLVEPQYPMHTAPDWTLAHHLVTTSAGGTLVPGPRCQERARRVPSSLAQSRRSPEEATISTD